MKFVCPTCRGTGKRGCLNASCYCTGECEKPCLQCKGDGSVGSE